MIFYNEKWIESRRLKIVVTLIDVVLHNNNGIMKSETIDFPYSDNKLIVCQCDFESRNTNQFKLLRKLDERNSIINPEERMFSFKNSIVSILDEIAPLRLVKLKKKKSLP